MKIKSIIWKLNIQQNSTLGFIGKYYLGGGLKDTIWALKQVYINDQC